MGLPRVKVEPLLCYARKFERTKVVGVVPRLGTRSSQAHVFTSRYVVVAKTRFGLGAVFVITAIVFVAFWFLGRRWRRRRSRRNNKTHTSVALNDSATRCTDFNKDKELMLASVKS